MRSHAIRALTFTGFALAVLGTLWWFQQLEVPAWLDFAAIFVLMIVWKLVDDRLGVGKDPAE